MFELLASSYLMLCIGWSQLDGGSRSCGPPPEPRIYSSHESCEAALEIVRPSLEASLKAWVSSHFSGEPAAEWPDREWVECRE
jgi:hypothetical protein